MQCRIGLVAKHNIQNTPDLNLGEYIGDKNDTQLLYGLHEELSYLYPFWGIPKKKGKITEITPTNISDFIYLQDKYCLTKKIFLAGRITNNIVLFEPPKLYDLSCGVELFEDRVIKTVVHRTLSSNNLLIFVIPPYNNPLCRGLSIDTCLEMYQENSLCKALFIVVGGKVKPNLTETWKLSQRYLIKRGISNSDIVKTRLFNDNIIKTVLGLIPDMTSRNHNVKVYVSVKSKDMNKYLLQSRVVKKDIRIFFLGF